LACKESPQPEVTIPILEQLACKESPQPEVTIPRFEATSAKCRSIFV